MQGIECPIPQMRGITPAQFAADRERRLRESDFNPYSHVSVSLELHIYSLSLTARELSLEYVTLDRVDPFCVV
jgi:hypothetical protein